MAILAFDKYWQYPAITELHAFKQLQNRLNTPLSGVVYLAFPWATLFDLQDRNRDSPVLQELLTALAALTARIKVGSRVVTVCQHIRLARHSAHLVDAGVTDVFWSHTAENSRIAGLTLWSFPLYPVNQVEAKPFPERTILASFIGAKANQFYPTQSRNLLAKIFSGETDCIVALNESWQFNHTVYDIQVKQLQFSANTSDFTDRAYITTLADSVFALCPSGTGPNSIRLWEAINAGVIPVVITDYYQPPGNRALWEQACLFCSENADALSGLPALLRELYADKLALRHKLIAVSQLRALYGVQSFVSDIEALIWQLETAYLLTTPLQDMANRVLLKQCAVTKRTLEQSHNSYQLLAKPIVTPSFVQYVLQQDPAVPAKDSAF